MMANLRESHRLLIVVRLATFVAPTEIQAELRQLGVDVPLTQIAAHDPTLTSDLSAQWRELYDATRDAFVTAIADVGIVHRAFRLRELDALYHQAKKRGDIELAAALLEQAAKEVGNVYTNRLVLTGNDDGP